MWKEHCVQTKRKCPVFEINLVLLQKQSRSFGKHILGTPKRSFINYTMIWSQFSWGENALKDWLQEFNALIHGSTSHMLKYGCVNFYYLAIKIFPKSISHQFFQNTFPFGGFKCRKLAVYSMSINPAQREKLDNTNGRSKTWLRYDTVIIITGQYMMQLSFRKDHREAKLSTKQSWVWA